MNSGMILQLIYCQYVLVKAFYRQHAKEIADGPAKRSSRHVGDKAEDLACLPNGVGGSCFQMLEQCRIFCRSHVGGV